MTKLKLFFVAVLGFFTAMNIGIHPMIGSCESGSAEIVMEVNSRRVLYGKNISEEKAMASTTKILTAIILIEDNDLSQVVKIPKEAEGVEGSSVYLKAGDEYTVEDLLYGLMLRSGNDCSVALALSHSESVEKFAECMNSRARELGALNSHFVNPNGLPDKEHYTTAYDLGMISCYAMQNETFRKIVSTKYYEKCGWANKNKMLYNYEGANGVKTGYTMAAGRCLVTSAFRGGMQLICIVLNCHEMYEETAKLLDEAFSEFSYERICRADTLYTAPSDVKGKDVDACIAKDLYYPLREEELPLVVTETELPPFVSLPVKKGDVIGNIKIYFANQLIFCENLCSINNVEKTYLDILKGISESFYL